MKTCMPSIEFSAFSFKSKYIRLIALVLAIIEELFEAILKPNLIFN
jgi:hypothetical protein